MITIGGDDDVRAVVRRGTYTRRQLVHATCAWTQHAHVGGHGCGGWAYGACAGNDDDDKRSGGGGVAVDEDEDEDEVGVDGRGRAWRLARSTRRSTIVCDRVASKVLAKARRTDIAKRSRMRGGKRWRICASTRRLWWTSGGGKGT